MCLSGDGFGGIKESAWQGSVGFICFGPLACLLAWADGRTCALIVSGLVISSLHASVVPLHFSFGWLNQFYILCCCLIKTRRKCQGEGACVGRGGGGGGADSARMI